jgi:hypothetical protein
MSRETADLVRSYYSIADHEARRRTLDLLRSIGESKLNARPAVRELDLA